MPFNINARCSTKVSVAMILLAMSTCFFIKTNGGSDDTVIIISGLGSIMTLLMNCLMRACEGRDQINPTDGIGSEAPSRPVYSLNGIRSDLEDPLLGDTDGTGSESPSRPVYSFLVTVQGKNEILPLFAFPTLYQDANRRNCYHEVRSDLEGKLGDIKETQHDNICCI